MIIMKLMVLLREFSWMWPWRSSMSQLLKSKRKKKLMRIFLPAMSEPHALLVRI